MTKYKIEKNTFASGKAEYQVIEDHGNLMLWCGKFDDLESAKKYVADRTIVRRTIIEC